MAEAADISTHAGEAEGTTGNVDWGRALIAALAATVVITVSMALFGMNIMKSLGAMVLGAGAGTGVQYAVGGVIHLMAGVGYGLVYASLFAPVRRWGALTKGAVFGLAIAAIALAAMPVMAAMMGGGEAANPCNPCGGGGGGSPYSGAISVVNHLLYSLTLAFAYGRGGAKAG